MPNRLTMVEVVRAALPGCLIVGDSTQAIYAANLYYDHDRPGGFFNAATGYGALGFAPGAAVGAALGAPGTPVICLIGDGGLQFTLPELASAVEAQVPLIVLLWNNQGYEEIKKYMLNRAIEPVGVDIHTPDFIGVAKALGCAAEAVGSVAQLRDALRLACDRRGPSLIEIDQATWMKAVQPC